MMKADENEIVIRYKLRRDECPELFDNFAAVPKGLPRANRLKVLALRGFDARNPVREDTDQSCVPATPQPPRSHRRILSDLIEGRVGELEALLRLLVAKPPTKSGRVDRTAKSSRERKE